MDERPITGLDRREVRLVEHRPAWGRLALGVRDDILRAAGDLLEDVQHVGSTAVPGMVAKPILDLAALASDEADIPEIIGKLIAAGFMYGGDGGSDGGHLFMRESAPGVRTVHLHVVVSGDPQWEDYLVFRDLLRSDARVREEYEALKRTLLRRYPEDRAAYTSSKAGFITRVLRSAGAVAPEEGG